MQWRNYVIAILVIPAVYGIYAWNRGPEVQIQEKEVIKIVEKQVEVVNTQQKLEKKEVETTEKKPDGTVLVRKETTSVDTTNKVEERRKDIEQNRSKIEVKLEKYYPKWSVGVAVTTPTEYDPKKLNLSGTVSRRVLGDGTFLSVIIETDPRILDLRRVGVGVQFVW